MITIYSSVLKTFGQFFRDRCRTGFFYCTWFVFIFIVIEALYRNDLNDRICLAIHNSNCIFNTFYKFLYNYFIFISECTIQCFRVIFLIINNINTDTGTTAACLDNNREIHSQFLWSFHTILFLHGLTCRSRNASHLEHCLGHPFIHCHGTAQISGSGIWNTHQIKCTLQLTILTVSSMKSQENKICFFTEFDNIRSKEIFSCFFQFSHLRIKSSDISCCFFHIIFCRERIFPVYLFLTTENIYQNCLMSFLSQCSADSCSGYN